MLKQVRIRKEGKTKVCTSSEINHPQASAWRNNLTSFCFTNKNSSKQSKNRIKALIHHSVEVIQNKCFWTKLTKWMVQTLTLKICWIWSPHTNFDHFFHMKICHVVLKLFSLSVFQNWDFFIVLWSSDQPKQQATRWIVSLQNFVLKQKKKYYKITKNTKLQDCTL